MAFRRKQAVWFVASYLTAGTRCVNSSHMLRASRRFVGICDLPAASPDRNQERLEPISKILAREPIRVDQPEIVNGPQFIFETLEQFMCGVVELRVAVFHVKPLAGEFDRGNPPVNCERN